MSARRRRASILGALAAAIIVGLAFFASPFASTEPDGLDRVAADHGLDRAARDHPLDDAPTAGYQVRGVDDEQLSTGLAGLIGVVVTFLVVGGLLLALRTTAARRSACTKSPPEAPGARRTAARRSACAKSPPEAPGARRTEARPDTA